MKKQVTTLCLVHQHPKLLLGMKKRGFGVGRWNGFGGKVHPKESIEEAATRELREEAGIEAASLECAGKLLFTFEDTNEVPIECHVFRISEFTGDPVETDEMRPEWFATDTIPYRDMWPDDKDWVPLFLEGKKFDAHFHFLDFDTVGRSSITVLK